MFTVWSNNDELLYHRRRVAQWAASDASRAKEARDRGLRAVEAALA